MIVFITIGILEKIFITGFVLLCVCGILSGVLLNVNLPSRLVD